MNDLNHKSSPRVTGDGRPAIASSNIGALSARARAAWPQALVLLAVVTASAIAIWPTWPPLFTTWRVMPDYDHALLLVPFIVVWLAARCEHLPRPAARVSPVALTALLVSIAVWLVAYQASSNIGEQLVTPAILWTAVWAAFGLPIALRVAVPVACLYFAIPLWEFLVPILQSVAVRVAETALSLVGVPVHIDGVLVSIPEGTFKIAEGCAGRRYFVVCVTIAALLAGTSRMRPSRAILFLSIAAALSVVVNWFRIVSVIYAGHITNMQSYFVRVEHISYGWTLFAALMALVCLIGSRLARTGALPPATDEHDWASAGASKLLLRPAVPITILVLALPALAVANWRRELAYTPASSDDNSAVLTLPASADGWRGPGSPDEGWRPQYRGAVAEKRVSYNEVEGDVEVFVAQYSHEQPGAKLVSYENSLYPENWMVLHRGVLDRGAGLEAGGRARALRLKTPDGERWTISYLYRVDGFTTGSDAAAQIAHGLLGWNGKTHSRIAAVASRCRPSCDSAEHRIDRFWAVAGAQLIGQP